MQPSYTIAELAEAKAKLSTFFKENYYTSRPYVTDKYKSHDLTALKQALADMSQLPWRYKAGYFDCSEMSALVELYLEVAGFDTVIVIGRDPQVQGPGHAWVVVFLSQGAVPVEATALAIPKPTGNIYGQPPNQVVMNYGDYLRSGWVLRDIYEAVIYNPGDFDWWNSYPLSLDELFGKPPSTATPTPIPSPVPAEYLELPSLSYVGITPPQGEPYRLYEILLRIRWDTNWSNLYKTNEFDCSEMSGLLENYLESNGFNTYILCAEVTERDWAWALEMELERVVGLREGGRAYHAWTAVKFGDEYMAIESTIPCITNYYGAYKYQCIYNTAQEAERAYPGQFDYWNSPQYGVLKNKLPTPVKPLAVNFDGWYAGSSKITTATKDSVVTARVVLTNGESGHYTLRVRRDIVGGTDETIDQLAFNYDGVSGTMELSFTPPYATGEANTDGYHLDLLKDAYIVWTLTDAYPPRLRVTLPPPTPTPPPAPSQYEAKVIDETIIVKAGEWNAYFVTIDIAETPNCRITGSFSASGGSGNDIEFLVFNESNYKKWEYEMQSITGSPASIPALHRSGRVTSGSFDISVSHTDTYYLVWSNHFSIFSNKAVKVQVYLAYSKQAKSLLKGQSGNMENKIVW
jgi:hypothetical protein